VQVGSSDGSVTVWKNVSVSRLSAGAHPSAGTPQTANRSSGFDSGDKTNLCASFLALPDIDCSPSVDDKGKYYTFPIPLPAKQGMMGIIGIGSGLLTSWSQMSGYLTVAGNSPTIRRWDLTAEQTVRVFQTGDYEIS